MAPAAASARTQERVRELVDGARRLADLNLFDEASLQAKAAQQLDPTNPDVAALLEAIDGGQRRARLIESRIEDIERLIAQESFRDALAHLIDAVAELGDAEELQDLRARIEQLEAQHRFSSAAALVKEAQSLVEARSFTDAIARLEQAEDLDPGNTVVRNHLAEVREAMRGHEQAHRQATLVTESAEAVEALIAAHDYERARTRLREALQRCGDNPVLVGLGDRISALESEDRAKRVATLLAEAASATSKGDHRKAVGVLEQASTLDPTSAEVAGRLREARDTLRTAEEEEKRAAEIAEQTSAVESLLASGRLVDARARLNQALDRLGLHPTLLALGERILELEAAERTREVSALLEEAASHSATGDHAAAIAALELALELDPDSPTVTSKLAAERAAQSEGERRRRGVERAVAAVEELLAAGEVERAVERAEAATAELGPSDELGAVRLRAIKARDEQLAALAAKRQRDDATRQVPKEAPTEAGPVPGFDRTVAIPSAAARAAATPEPVSDRTTALPVGQVAVPAPPMDRTMAVPSEAPKTPAPPKAEPKFKPRKPVPPPAPRPPVAEAPAIPVVAPKVEKPVPPAAAARPRTAQWMVIGGVAALVAIVVAVVAMWPDKGPPAGGDTGTMVINAVPWAQVESIVDAQSSPQQLAGSTYTPLAVALPPGRYRISLRNPSRSEPLVVEAEVKIGETARAPLADFGPIEVSTVLEKYGL